MENKNQPADFRFGDETELLTEDAHPEHSGDFYGEDTGSVDEFGHDNDEFADRVPEEVGPRKRRKATPPWLLLVGAIGFFAIIGLIGTYVVIKKRAAHHVTVIYPTQVPQPRIVQPLPPLPATPSGASNVPQGLSAPAPLTSVQTHAAPQSQVHPVSATSGSQSVPQTAISAASTSAAAASPPNRTRLPVIELESPARVDASTAGTAIEDKATHAAIVQTAADLTDIKKSMAMLLTRMDRLEQQMQRVSATPAHVAAHPVARPATTGHSAPPPAAFGAPVVRQDYRISGIVNNRAFIVHRNADGTDSELSVSPGDKVAGLRVLSVDARSRRITLEDNQIITLSR